MKIRTTFTTAISFYVQTTSYDPDYGPILEWAKFESALSETENIDVFWCEWVGSYGDMKMSAQAQGVSESARVRMPFIPELYEKLRSQKVLIAKNADEAVIVNNHPVAAYRNAYMIWGGVDNVREENQLLEFNVRRYEVI